MQENYEDIVRKWYNRLQPDFLKRLTRKYSGLTLQDAENLYQDAFLAVYDNLKKGSIKEDTNWSSYIISIGLNLAGKEWRKAGITDSADEGFNSRDEDPLNMSRKIDEILKSLPSSETEEPMYKNIEVQSLLGDEIAHTPEPCNKIIHLYYFGDCNMEEIAEEIGFKNASSVKSKKSQCMTEFIARLTKSLRLAGFDVTPKRRNRNGRN